MNVDVECMIFYIYMYIAPIRKGNDWKGLEFKEELLVLFY